MKTHNLKIAGLLVIIMALAVPMTQCSETADMDGALLTDEELLDVESGQVSLSEEQIKGILFMREEEKLARDVYLYLYEVHPLRPFLNISKSEQAHMDAIKYLIDLYELEDPVGENPEGKFQNEDLQQMYNDLIEAGSVSRESALGVGALIEEIDIIDLQREMELHNDNEEVIRVFGNLSRASENHLRAFVRVLRLYDVEYEPEKLDQTIFDQIMEK